MKPKARLTAGLLSSCMLLAAICDSAHADFSEAIKNYNNKNYAEAMAEFKRSAVLGHKQSQFNIGIMYYRGEGVQKDLIEAFAWLALSATDKDPKRVNSRDEIMGRLDEAQKDAAIDRMENLLKEINSDSQKLTPVLISEEQCKFHLKKVKMQPVDYPWSMLTENKQSVSDVEFTIDKFGFPRDYLVTMSINKEADKAIYDSLRYWRYEPVIIEGRPTEVAVTQVRFRFVISNGAMDQKELKKYVEELRDKAKSGNPNDLYAAAYIGSLIPELKIKRDESNLWFYEAAKAGVSKAQYEIGKSLFRGEGCEQDTRKGLQWLTMAAEERNIVAQYFLGISLLGSDKIQEDKLKAIEWLNKAASGHHEKAMMRLAWMLATDKENKVRDPLRSLALVNEVYKDYADRFRSNEVLAAAQAANGMFDDAVKSQRAALKEAKSIRYPLDDVQARLTAYQSKQPWLE